MIENVLVRHVGVTSEAEKIGAVERCEVEEEGGRERNDEDRGCVGVFEDRAGDPRRGE